MEDTNYFIKISLEEYWKIIFRYMEKKPCIAEDLQKGKEIHRIVEWDKNTRRGNVLERS